MESAPAFPALWGPEKDTPIHGGLGTMLQKTFFLNRLSMITCMACVVSEQAIFRSLALPQEKKVLYTPLIAGGCGGPSPPLFHTSLSPDQGKVKKCKIPSSASSVSLLISSCSVPVLLHLIVYHFFQRLLQFLSLAFRSYWCFLCPFLSPRCLLVLVFYSLSTMFMFFMTFLILFSLLCLFSSAA